MTPQDRDVQMAITNGQAAVIQNIHGGRGGAAAASYHWRVSADAWRRLGNEAEALKAEACIASIAARAA